MRFTGQLTLFLILLIISGLILIAGCTQKADTGPSPLAGQAPGPQNPPGQPGQGPGGPGPADQGQPGPQNTPGQPGPGPSGEHPCPPMQIRCGDLCIDPAHDGANCGSCGNACLPGTPCNNGLCGSGTAGIPGTPVTPGIPGTPVTPGIPGTTVTTGTVVTTTTSGTTSCSSGLTNCAGSCVDTQTSSQHCGKCNNPCPAGESCGGGSCGKYIVGSVMTLDPQTLCTASGKLWCSGSCIGQDGSNCGSCGHACKAGEVCSQGKCLSWTGSWKIVPYDFACVQTGTTVTCNYSDSTMTVILFGTTAGSPPKFTGTLNGMIGKGYSDTGTFEFDMSADGKQFTGWSYLKSTGSNKNSVTGTRL